MKRCYGLILGLILLINCNFISAVFGEDAKVIPLDRELQAAVDQVGQKKVIVVPGDPLDFDSTLNWDLTITKKSLTSEKDPASMLIEVVGKEGQPVNRQSASGSGTLKIPKGTQYKITLSAGEYSWLLGKGGADVKLKLKYTEVQLTYMMGDKPYLFNLSIQGMAGFNQWNWFWSNNDRGSGGSVSHQFSSDGKVLVVVEGSGKNPSGLTSRKYSFELDVPPLLILNPQVGPLTGPVELPVSVKVNAQVNYGQKATYNWSFGNGIELTSPEANNTYTAPGKYPLVLTAKVGDYSLERNWLIEVTPLTIAPNPVVTPLTGPVPLDVTGTVNPAITGQPTKLKFTWEVAGKTIEDSSFKQSFTEPGNYMVRVKTVDQLHPDLVIADQVYMVKANPPELTVKPTTSISKGIIPLTVIFHSNLTVQGAPVEMIYHWDFGDGEVSYAPDPTHVFQKPGTYQVQLMVYDRAHPGNLTTAILPMEILPPEMKAIASANVSTGLVPLTVNFNGQVSITGSPCDPQFFWDFGDGETSLDQNPVHSYRQEGKFPVTLVVKDRLHPGNSSQSDLQVETKMPKLRLTASLTPTSGNSPLTVQGHAWGDKEGVANPKLKYVWDFGDGTQAEGTDPTHTYKQSGTYNVLVYVEDQELGLTERKTFKVTVK